jgi:hypothetical protein
MLAIVPVAGEGLRTLRAGAEVPVGWQQGRPVVAIAHSARRTGAPVPLSTPLAGIVETLFIADDPDSGQKDVFFRNHDQAVSLGIRPLLPAIPRRSAGA